MVDMKDYYQTNKGRLLGIGGILIIVGLVLYFARGQETVLILPSLELFYSLPALSISRKRKRQKTAMEKQHK